MQEHTSRGPGPKIKLNISCSKVPISLQFGKKLSYLEKNTEIICLPDMSYTNKVEVEEAHF
jgi:hypothetical protein